MPEPLFADTWYEIPRPDQLRQEIQELYRIISEQEERIQELEDTE